MVQDCLSPLCGLSIPSVIYAEVFAPCFTKIVSPQTPHWKCPIGIEIGVEDSALGLALWAEGHQVPSTGCDHTITVGLSQPQPPAPPLLFS